MKNFVLVNCSVCEKQFEKSAHKATSLKYYCKECRGHTELSCVVCKKKFTVWNSQLRKNENRVCSIACKSIEQRVPWEDLTRGMLKQRWIKEFGKEKLKCNRCGHDKPYNIEIHHKIYLTNGGKHNPKNLEPLCKNCHGIEHYENGKDVD